MFAIETVPPTPGKMEARKEVRMHRADEERIKAAADELLQAANAVHPRLVARGGGVRDIEVRRLSLPGGDSALAVHLLVDTRDAMGANLVNTICETVAPRVAEICGGKAAMRILSNLADRSLVRAEVKIPTEALANNGYDGEQVRDGMEAAELGVRQRCCIRLNPDVDAHTHEYTTTGREINKFGIDVGRVPACGPENVASIRISSSSMSISRYR